MDRKEFWALIEESKKFEDQVEWLLEGLSQKELNDILDFEFHLESLMNETYQSSLWGAAYVLMGGCSDDAFDYFRGWLIGQGEEIFHKVLENHEFLAEYITEENLDDEGYPQNEELISVGLEAYTIKRTGDNEWDDDIHDELLEKLDQKGLIPAEDFDFDWEEDTDDLEKMFPKLWAKFGENPLG